MSFGLGSQSSHSRGLQQSSSSSASHSAPSTPADLAAYWTMLDQLTRSPEQQAQAARAVAAQQAKVGDIVPVQQTPAPAAPGAPGQDTQASGAARFSPFTSVSQALPIALESGPMQWSAKNYLDRNMGAGKDNGGSGGYSYNGKVYPTWNDAQAARDADLAAAAQTGQASAGGGRLTDFAQNGTAPTPWTGPTQQQIADITDPSVFGPAAQSLNLLGDNYQGLLDPKLTNTAAAIGLAVLGNKLQTEGAQNRYTAGVHNAGLTASDLATLANIFFGGKGQVSDSTSQSSALGTQSASGGGFNFNINGSDSGSGSGFI